LWIGNQLLVVAIHDPVQIFGQKNFSTANHANHAKGDDSGSRIWRISRPLLFSALPNLNEVEPQSPRLPRRGATLGTPSEIIFNLNEVVAKLLPNGPHLETRSHNLVEVGDLSLIVLPEVARQTGSLGLCAATSLRL